ncbi:Hypothetical protein LUCI_4586 [Lucifera butyrica]|uniref:Uncharacterized protein n=1 Tax=Lucifera butyrica TaxID=1351585 RepID=A0A498R9B0_9FIRM|nr:hypothetical protein [Lucifera butyrica]VBB09296.1 Hypothetical protein LUCI_4586 [Lucifera butyrica]
MKKHIVAGILILCLVSIAAVPVTQAFGLGDILKVGGIGILVDKFAGPLNSFVNTLTMNHNAGSDYATKVVPILSIGSGGYIGAAQVSGPQDQVDRVAAVFQIEGNFGGDQFRVKALVPSDSKNPLKLSRVQGVGVSAVIDVRI